MTTPVQNSGYNTFGDVVQVTVDGRDINALWEEFQLTLDIFNQQRQHLVNIMTFPVTALIEDVPQVGEAEFEFATEFGVPQGARVKLNYFSLGYDFNDYDIAQRYTWQFLRDADARQVEAIHQAILTADNRLIFRRVMEAMFDNRNRNAQIRNQPVNVYPLYNADGTVPPPYKATTFTGTHTHYLTSNSQGVETTAVIDSADLEAMYDTIAEHGYGMENGTTFVALMPKALMRTVRTWKAGMLNGNPGNQVVANYDFVPAAGQPTMIVPNAEGLLGALPPSSWNGLQVVGSYAGVLLIEEEYIPAGYVLMLGSGGVGNLQNPVGLREHINPQYRGLRLLPGNQQRYPLVDAYYSRSFGTGVRQRAGAAIMQITSNATYTIPSQYMRGTVNL